MVFDGFIFLIGLFDGVLWCFLTEFFFFLCFWVMVFYDLLCFFLRFLIVFFMFFSRVLF